MDCVNWMKCFLDFTEKRIDWMNIIYADYNIYRNSIDICTYAGIWFIDFVLDTVLLLHKLFCMVHQYGKWRYNYQSVTDDSLFRHIYPRYALDGTVEMYLGLK